MKCFYLGIVLVFGNLTLVAQSFTYPKVDSLITRKDSLFHEFDIITNNSISSIDSIRQLLEKKLLSSTKKFNDQIDSLSTSGLPFKPYKKGIDSLYYSFSQNINQLKEKSDSLGQGLNQRIHFLDSIINSKKHILDSLLSTSGIDKLKQFSLPEGFSAHIPELPNDPLDQQSRYKINTSFDVPKISTPFGLAAGTKMEIPQTDVLSKLNIDQEILQDVKDYTGRAEELINKKNEINEGDLINELGKEAEDQIKKIDYVNSLSKETEAAEQVKNQFDSFKEKSQSPDELKEQARKEFVDYFSGKEELVKKDIADVAELQTKYRNVADMRFLPKRPPNEMRGKPFIERLVPGVGFQVFQNDNTSVDVAPFLGYKFSGRIRVGVSAYRRVTYFKKDDSLKPIDYFGYRLYNNIRIFKSIYSHIEFELYKPDEIQRNTLAYVHPKLYNNTWQNKVNLGFDQTYSIGKRFTGHFMIMYDLTQIKKFPNTIGSSARFGFDYQLMKGKK